MKTSEPVLEPAIDQEESPLDAIAALLPMEYRERYYRRMAHLRRLPSDDEILQVLEAMGFLGLITQRVPGEMAREREQLSKLMERCLAALGAFQQANAAYHRELDARLQRLPAEIAKGIAPEAIAATIRESLRQRFAETGMPQTAETLSVTAFKMDAATKDLRAALTKVIDPEIGVVVRVNHTVDQMEIRLRHAADYVEQLSVRFFNEVVRKRIGLEVGLMGLAFVAGMLFWRWWASR